MYYAVRRASVVTGRDLRNARPTLDENNLPAVGFSLNSDGARKFGTATEQNIGRQLAIVLDGRVTSAPVDPEPHLGRGAHQRRRSRSRKRRTCRCCCARARCRRR